MFAQTSCWTFKRWKDFPLKIGPTYRKPGCTCDICTKRPRGGVLRWMHTVHSRIIGAKRFEGILQIGRCLCPAGGGGGLQEGEGVREGWMGGWRVKGLDSGGWGPPRSCFSCRQLPHRKESESFIKSLFISENHNLVYIPNYPSNKRL